MFVLIKIWHRVSSNIVVSIYHSLRPHNPEDSNLQSNLSLQTLITTPKSSICCTERQCPLRCCDTLTSVLRSDSCKLFVFRLWIMSFHASRNAGEPNDKIRKEKWLSTGLSSTSCFKCESNPTVLLYSLIFAISLCFLYFQPTFLS
jgi:hypothetical protein